MLEYLLEQYLAKWYTCKQEGWGEDPGGFGPDTGVTDIDWGSDPGGFGQGEGPSPEQWAKDLQTWASTPWTQEQFDPYRNVFGSNVGEMNPFTREKTLTTMQAGWPGFTEDYWGGKTYRPNPLAAPAPKFLSKLYPSNMGQSIGSLIQFAQKGIKDWTAGGPNAPKILTPRDWEDMLPTEREGMIGFLEYIGIPWDDYQAMMQRQQESTMQAFGIDTKFRPARQR